MDQLRGKPLEGEWWEPQRPSDPFKGILQIEENNHGSLTIRGSEKQLLAFFPPGTRTIFGRLSDYRFDVTLFDVGIKRSLSGFTDWGERETDIQLFTNIILIGGHITSQDECIIGAAALRATGLGEWCDTTGFSSQIDRPEPTYTMERAQVSYEASASEFYPLDAGKSLRFISHLRPSPLFDGPKKVKMSEEDIIELRFNDKISINDVLHETSIWQNFLTVALRKASYLDDLRLSIGSADTPNPVGR
jgi:ApeA N-terminal domain 1